MFLRAAQVSTPASDYRHAAPGAGSSASAAAGHGHGHGHGRAGDDDDDDDKRGDAVAAPLLGSEAVLSDDAGSASSLMSV